jgi:hypothetical protein
MRELVTIFGVATAALAFVGCACAQDAGRSETDGWYLAGGGSVSLLNDAHRQIIIAPVPGGTVETVIPMNTGYGAQLAVGRKFGNFRTAPATSADRTSPHTRSPATTPGTTSTSA